MAGAGELLGLADSWLAIWLLFYFHSQTHIRTSTYKTSCPPTSSTSFQQPTVPSSYLSSPSSSSFLSLHLVILPILPLLGLNPITTRYIINSIFIRFFSSSSSYPIYSVHSKGRKAPHSMFENDPLGPT